MVRAEWGGIAGYIYSDRIGSEVFVSERVRVLVSAVLHIPVWLTDHISGEASQLEYDQTDMDILQVNAGSVLTTSASG